MASTAARQFSFCVETRYYCLMICEVCRVKHHLQSWPTQHAIWPAHHTCKAHLQQGEVFRIISYTRAAQSLRTYRKTSNRSNVQLVAFVVQEC